MGKEVLFIVDRRKVYVIVSHFQRVQTDTKRFSIVEIVSK